MNVASNSTNGYAKYQIRSSGIDRVLAEESTVFSIDDHEEEQNKTEDTRTEFKQPGEKSRLVNCPLDSDDEGESAQNDTLTPTHINRAKNCGNDKEMSHLTDEYDLDGDSVSDELDLLPPMGSGGSGSIAWNCCQSRVPMKCTIM